MKNFRSVLAAGNPKLGLCCMWPAPGMIERIGPDWDWVWVDAQHGEMDYRDVVTIVRACDLVGIPALVRVASHEFGGIGKVLDAGATGVIVPQVNTVEEARAVVQAAKFPPVGDRSFGGRRVIDRRGRGYVGTANADTLLICQIESPEALANADAIAAVPGVDVLFLGPDDTKLRRGGNLDVPYTSPELKQDLETVATAAHRHGKFALGIAIGAEMLKMCHALGFELIVYGSEVRFLAEASKQAATSARELLK